MHGQGTPEDGTLSLWWKHIYDMIYTTNTETIKSGGTSKASHGIQIMHSIQPICAFLAIRRNSRTCENHITHADSPSPTAKR